jgi:hypothetical protein
MRPQNMGLCDTFHPCGYCNRESLQMGAHPQLNQSCKPLLSFAANASRHCFLNWSVAPITGVHHLP